MTPFPILNTQRTRSGHQLAICGYFALRAISPLVDHQDAIDEQPDSVVDRRSEAIDAILKGHRLRPAH